MKQLTAQQTKWLEFVHLIFVCAWIGGAMALVLVQYSKSHLAGPEGQYAILAALRFIDDFVIIPGALGSLLTGLIYSLATPWGFFKQHWVSAKWVVTISLILFGTFGLGPWLNGMEEMARIQGIRALTDSTFLYYQASNQVGGCIQLACNIIMVGISVIKPWRKSPRVLSDKD